MTGHRFMPPATGEPFEASEQEISESQQWQDWSPSPSGSLKGIQQPRHCSASNSPAKGASKLSLSWIWPRIAPGDHYLLPLLHHLQQLGQLGFVLVDVHRLDHYPIGLRLRLVCRCPAG